VSGIAEVWEKLRARYTAPELPQLFPKLQVSQGFRSCRWDKEPRDHPVDPLRACDVSEMLVADPQ
jgi:hypothetical protein